MAQTSSYNNPPIKNTSHDGGPRRSSFGQWQALCVQCGITGVVGEVEAGHFDVAFFFLLPPVFIGGWVGDGLVMGDGGGPVVEGVR